jgi:urease accessory protein
MLHAREITKTPSAVHAVRDRVVLDYDQRHRRRIVVKGVKGTEILLDLAEVPDLRDGDALVLDSGERVVVEAAPEDLMEITCADPVHLARIAWHLGNRHLAAEIRGTAIRIRTDHVIAAMAAGLGATVRPISAPFNPEGGAYGSAHNHKAHSHGPQ